MIRIVKKYGIAAVLNEVEYQILLSVAHLSNAEAAKFLRIPITTYRSKVKKFNIKK